MPERRVVAADKMSNRAKFGFAALVVAVVTVCGAIGGSIWATGLVESRLRRLAEGAGLGLQVDSISVSPFGEVRVSNLHLVRPDGTDVIAVAGIDATLSPLRAVMGSRRPETLTIDGLNVEIRMQDGRPDELIDLVRSARAALGKRGADAEEADDSGDAKRAATALTLRGGEVAVVFIGRYKDLLPGGLVAKDIELRLAPEQGIGEASAQIMGAVTSKLSAQIAKAVPGQAPANARVVGLFTPALRLPLPPVGTLPVVADHIVIEGFEYDGDAGPSVRGLRLVHGDDDAVRIADVRVEAGWPLASAIEVSPATLARLAQMPATSNGDGDGDGDAKPSQLQRLVPTLPAKMASIGLASSDDGDTMVVISRFEAPLGNNHGMVRFQSLAVQTAMNWKASPAGKDANAARTMRLTLSEPTLTLRWSRPDILAFPGGEATWTVVERARQRPDPSADADDEDDDDEADDVDRPDLAPEARGDRASRAEAKSKANGKKGAARGGRAKKRPRVSRPASAHAIPALKSLLADATSLDGHARRLFGILANVAGLELHVTGAAILLAEPAAAAPFGGLRAGRLDLTASLGDGTRGLDGEIEIFLPPPAPAAAPTPAAPAATGAAKNAAAPDQAGGKFSFSVDFKATGGIEVLKVGFSGGAFAAAAASLGAVLHLGPGATLAGALTLHTEAEGSRAVVSGQLDAVNVGIDWWRLSPRPIDGLNFSATLNGSADAKAHEIKLSVDPLKVGEASAKVLIEATHIGPKAVIHARFELPKQDCAKLAAAIPASLVPTIGVITAKGELAADVDLSVPLATPYKSKFDANLDDMGCTAVHFEHVDLAELRGPFARPVNESGTILEDQLIGPKSEAWVALADLPAWVPYTMMATEDAAFYHHRGLRLGLLSRAIKMNLDYGRFVYGGSTLTQQLVKNLYLTRDKYLGRKFEELLIVWHMERTLGLTPEELVADDGSNVIPPGTDDGELGDPGVRTKDRILELYCNIVEFAPHLYGVERAAQTYFGRSATTLTPLEVAFLAANKPHPRVGFRLFETRKWTDWWQERMVGILKKMRKDEIITEEQFIAEAPYVPRFLGWPAPERPSAETTGAIGVGGVEE